MLALLGFLGLTNIHAMNGLKNFFNLCINFVAAGYFILRGAVFMEYWRSLGIMSGMAVLLFCVCALRFRKKIG